MGGKHQKPSKFSIDHVECEASTCTRPIDVPPQYQYFTRKSSGEVHLSDAEDSSSLVGCKKSSNVNRFYDRTAGIMALVRPLLISVRCLLASLQHKRTFIFILLLDAV